MRAITTRYRGPTDRGGAKIVASSERSRVVVPYGHGDPRAEHRKAAVALCERLNWGNCDRLHGGGTKDGYAFVFVPKSCKCPSGSLAGARGRRPKRKRRR